MAKIKVFCEVRDSSLLFIKGDKIAFFASNGKKVKAECNYFFT